MTREDSRHDDPGKPDPDSFACAIGLKAWMLVDYQSVNGNDNFAITSPEQEHSRPEKSLAPCARWLFFSAHAAKRPTPRANIVCAGVGPALGVIHAVLIPAIRANRVNNELPISMHHPVWPA